MDDSGPYLAALITQYAFVSLFPLLLLMSTILGDVPPVIRSSSNASSTRR